jgi:hypothetical protein
MDRDIAIMLGVIALLATLLLRGWPMLHAGNVAGVSAARTAVVRKTPDIVIAPPIGMRHHWETGPGLHAIQQQRAASGTVREPPGDPDQLAEDPDRPSERFLHSRRDDGQHAE